MTVLGLRTPSPITSIWIVWALAWDAAAYRYICALHHYYIIVYDIIVLIVSISQVTFQACDIEEARHLYDQLAVICPVMVSRSSV